MAWTTWNEGIRCGWNHSLSGLSALDANRVEAPQTTKDIAEASLVCMKDDFALIQLVDAAARFESDLSAAVVSPCDRGRWDRLFHPKGTGQSCSKGSYRKQSNIVTGTQPPRFGLPFRGLLSWCVLWHACSPCAGRDRVVRATLGWIIMNSKGITSSAKNCATDTSREQLIARETAVRGRERICEAHEASLQGQNRRWEQ